MEILVGPNLTVRLVEAIPFLPGLVVHKAPDAPGQDMYSVSHRASGLAVLTHIPEQYLSVTQRMLGDACWTVTPDDIFENPEYYLLIRSVLQVLRGRDVLGCAVSEDRRRCDPGADWGFFESVATPLMHVEEVVSDGDAVVSYEDIKRVQRNGVARGRLPALIVGVSRKEDVVILADTAFPAGFFYDLRVSLLDATLRGYVTVTPAMADRAVRGHCTRASFGSERFVMLGYLPFLRLVKRGLL